MLKVQDQQDDGLPANYVEATHEELVAFIEGLPRMEFTNPHGEKFTLHSQGITVFMSGSEVDTMVDDIHKIAGKYINIFNPAFQIWNVSELQSFGEAITKLMTKIKKDEGIK